MKIHLHRLSLLVACVALVGCGLRAAPTVRVLTTDAEVLTEMQSFLDTIEAASGPDGEVVQGYVAQAARTLDVLSAAQPSDCIRQPLHTYVLRLTELRDAVARIAQVTPGNSVADDDYATFLGGLLGMGQAVEEAKSACALHPADTRRTRG